MLCKQLLARGKFKFGVLELSGTFFLNILICYVLNLRL